MAVGSIAFATDLGRVIWCRLLKRVQQPVGHQSRNVGIGQCVINVLSFSPRSHHAFGFQQPQTLGNGRHVVVQHDTKFRNAPLGRFQNQQNPQSLGVAQRPENRCSPFTSCRVDRHRTTGMFVRSARRFGFSGQFAGFRFNGHGYDLESRTLNQLIVWLSVVFCEVAVKLRWSD